MKLATSFISLLFILQFKANSSAETKDPTASTCTDPNAVYKDCASHCPSSCDNQSPICILSCAPAACQCKTGFVVGPTGGCITVDKCPVPGDICDTCSKLGLMTGACPDGTCYDNCGCIIDDKEQCVNNIVNKDDVCPDTTDTPTTTCVDDSECDVGWCRQQCTGTDKECVPFAGQGVSCVGFTMPCYQERCSADMTCFILYPMISNEPGICTVPCDPACGNGEICDQNGECVCDELYNYCLDPNGICAVRVQCLDTDGSFQDPCNACTAEQTCEPNYCGGCSATCKDLVPDTTDASCENCINPFTGECSYPAPCAYRDYCTTDETSEFYLTCDAYPDATCTFTSCGGCREYFVDYLGNIVDCDANTCELPQEVGPCDALKPRYYFNSVTVVCEQFNYGGCKGNANNFESLQECETECVIDICELPKEVGPCEALMPRYYFNSVIGVCEQFNYGGCEGNANNFETYKECQIECTDIDICQLPKVSGLCLAYFPRYYFNSNTEQCEEFIYGGCGANANNFENFKECQAECGGADVTTETPIDTTEGYDYCDKDDLVYENLGKSSRWDNSLSVNQNGRGRFDFCELCLCEEEGKQRRCEIIADVEIWPAVFEKLFNYEFNNICDSYVYTDLQDEDGNQCQLENVRPKSTDQIEVCDCSALLCCKGTECDTFMSNNGNTFGVFGIIGVMMVVILSWM